MVLLTVALRDQNENVVNAGTQSPVTEIGDGSYEGQAFVQVGDAAAGYRKNIWVWNATSTQWQCLPISPIIGTGNPNSVVTPDAIGQFFRDTAGGVTYLAQGTTNNDWGIV